MITFFLVAILTSIIAACQPQDSETSTTADVATAEPQPEFGRDGPDTTGAALWAYLQSENYQDTWTLWPGRGELYEGQEPHGLLLTTYLNDVALGAVENRSGTMPEGSIVAKENYMPDKTLAAVTVMYKVAGYNPDHNDWFFTKFLPDGTLDKMPNGMAMEGKIPGCQGCHSAKRDNDYLYTGSISASTDE